MDFSNITGMYADTYANAANQRAAGLQDKLKDADYARATDAELMDACKQFEAYFIEQMYKGMMKTIPTNENNSNYTATMMDYYKDQMVQAVAEETTNQNGGFGLAQMLYDQMKRNFTTTEIPQTADGSAAEGMTTAGVNL
nr:rod-binding protein [uncultured Acetatifactor sp.]